MFAALFPTLPTPRPGNRTFSPPRRWVTVNINPAAAKWFYDTLSFGDVVTVTGTQPAPDDGFGDWNIPRTSGK